MKQFFLEDEESNFKTKILLKSIYCNLLLGSIWFEHVPDFYTFGNILATFSNDVSFNE